MQADVYVRISQEQQVLCTKYGADYIGASLSSKLGISEDALKEVLPVHGLRHPPKGDISGWYIWSGDYLEEVDFFKPLHVKHVVLESMVFARYLGLAPGWRFLIGEDGYEDVWFDPELLAV